MRASDPSLVLVDDHGALRRGMELLLRRAGYRVIGQAGTAEEGYGLIRRRKPDVALLDIDLPDESGVELTKRLLDDDPGLGVLLYTGLGDDDQLARGLDCGARGFALKAGAPEELIDAVARVASGGAYVDPRLRPLMERSRGRGSGVLSAREREILRLLAEGLTGEEAAGRLFISRDTVRTHIRNAMRKLGVKTRVHAVVTALADGELDVFDG